MGNIYYGICLDCKKAVYLGKYALWRPFIKENQSLEDSIREEIIDLNELEKEYSSDERKKSYKDRWIECALYLHWFLGMHNGHRIWIGHDNEPLIDQHIDRHGSSFFDDYEIIYKYHIKEKKSKNE